MRKIKFRAWLPDAKIDAGMFYQEDQYLSSFLRRIYDRYIVTHPSYLIFDVEERLMQYTGLKDKNGKEIYEGDIVKGAWGVSQIIFFHGAWCYFGGGTTSRIYTSIKTAEVIGNIYENKDLLEDSK